MSDPWNPQLESETPHGKAQNFNTKTGGNAKQDQAESTDYARLYEQGIKLFKRAGFELVRSPSGSHCGHKVYRKSVPRQVNGITFPDWFRYLRLVETVEDETVLSNAMLRGVDSGHVELQQFWSPLTQPMSGVKSSPLQGYVERLAKIDSAHMTQNESEPLALGIQYSDFTKQTSKSHSIPRAFVPPTEWFNEKLRNVTFRDVFTLWPEAETSMLMLVLGRVMAGRSGSVPIGTDKVLEHTYRTVAIVIGEDAGLGKSTVFEKLFKAINLVGYQRVNFRDIGERFGIGDVADSDIAYKDDVTGKTLINLIGSENTKIIATGGPIVGEDKFQKANSTLSRTVLLANTNVWDPRSAYNLDPGTVDRIKLLTTYRRNELHKQGVDKCSSVASDSPNFAPFIHIPWLAKKLDVSEESLMLWACRLAVDEFTKYTFWRGEVPSEALRLKIHSLSSRLQYSFNKDSTRAIISCMLFSHVLLSHLQHKQSSRRRFEWREMNQEVLVKSFKDFRAFASDQGLYRLRELVRLHWEQNGRPDTHPWSGIRKLNVLSLRNAMGAMTEAVSRRAPLPELVKSTFEQLTLRDGFKGSTDIVWVTSAWQACRGYMDDIEQMARTISAIIDDDTIDPLQMDVVRERIGTLAGGTTDDQWLDDTSYTPSRVAELMPQHKGMNIAQYGDKLLSTKWSS